MNNYLAPFAIHPGETLKDILIAGNMSQVQLALRTGLHIKTINEIIKAKSPVTSETALKLSIVFGMSESFWNNLQKKYDETLTRISFEKFLEKETEMLPKFSCYPELVKYGYAANSKSSIERVKSLLNFFRISSFELLEKNYQVAFRRTAKENLSKENLIAWLRCGEIEAERIKTKPFDKEKLKLILPEIKKLNLLKANQYSVKLSEILAECGVAFVFVPYLKNTFVNGASRWLNPDKALIQLTTRNKKEDILWFTLFHELCHILKHSKKEGFVSFRADDFNANEYEELEKEADKFASEQLIPSKEWNSFIKGFDNKDSSIYNFASDIGVKPGIVAGRIGKETGNRSRFDKFRNTVEIESL